MRRASAAGASAVAVSPVASAAAAVVELAGRDGRRVSNLGRVGGCVVQRVGAGGVGVVDAGLGAVAGGIGRRRVVVGPEQAGRLGGVEPAALGRGLVARFVARGLGRGVVVLGHDLTFRNLRWTGGPGAGLGAQPKVSSTNLAKPMSSPATIATMITTKTMTTIE